MRKQIVVFMSAVVLAFGTAVAGQQTDPEVQKVLDEYQQAWNSGDAKALAAVYTQEAIRIGADGQPIVGRDAIEKSFAKNFAGPWKGTELTLRAGRMATVTPDVRLQEGTYEITGMSGGPAKGRFLNTIVRQGNRWRIASVAAIPDTGGAR